MFTQKWNSLLVLVLSVFTSLEVLVTRAAEVVSLNPKAIVNALDAGLTLVEQQTAAALSNEEETEWDRFTKSSYYVPPFNPKVRSMPTAQKEFIRRATAEQMEFFREIVQEAIRKRNSIAPAISLIFKYGAKLIGSFIKERSNEMKITPRIELEPGYFRLIADLVQKILDRSAQIKKEKGYTKQNVDAETIYPRLDLIFQYVEHIIDISPVAGFLRWDTMTLFKNRTDLPRHDLDFAEEVSDILAQCRAIGYERTMSVAKALVKLIRGFARNAIPDSSELEKDILILEYLLN